MTPPGPGNLRRESTEVLAVTTSSPRFDDVPDAYLGTLDEVAQLLVEEQSLDGLLEHILHLTGRSITSSAAVSVTVVDDGSYVTAASTDRRADAVDRVQYELAEGPCIDALETGREHHLLRLEEERRWPRFVEQARELGFDGVLSVPLSTAGGTLGALNVFVQQPDALTDDDVELARRIAAPAATTLANADAYRRVARLADQLQEALDSRAIIEQAKGVLMARQGCDADEAFDLLRQLSQSSNRKLRHIAADVVAHTVARRASDLRVTEDGQAAAGRATDGQAAAGRATDGHAAGGPANDGQAAEGAQR
jgi:transcriptional regulator with GAF, ATPase, and Fis domain